MLNHKEYRVTRLIQRGDGCAHHAYFKRGRSGRYEYEGEMIFISPKEMWDQLGMEEFMKNSHSYHIKSPTKPTRLGRFLNWLTSLI